MARTERSWPARRALRRSRWASYRAITQVKVCTAMLWSVQWYIGANDTSWGLSCRKPNSISDCER
jgi:hypothetical protein